VLKSLDLSEIGDVEEAMRNFYSHLREAELIQEAKTILVVGKDDFTKSIKRSREFATALFDKMFRSASGQFIYVTSDMDGSLRFYK